MKRKTIRYTFDIFSKIFWSFLAVGIFYAISLFVNDFGYDYFIFPLVSFLIIFMCGVNVGKALEKMSKSTTIGHVSNYSVRAKNNKNVVDHTVFKVNEDTDRVVTTKKILKEVKEDDKIHIKVFNYNDLVMNDNSDINDIKERER